MTSIAIIVGSTRPGRKAADVAAWVHGIAAQRSDAEFEIVDLADFELPVYDEPVPPAMGAPYTHAHTQRWSDAISRFDGFVFVTPEYNHSVPGALKNAIDYLYPEWNDKAAGFVGYGTTGGSRAIEHLRAIMGELQVADVRAQVGLSLITDFENWSVLRPADQQVEAVGTLLDQVVAWSSALRAVREAGQPVAESSAA